MDMPTQDTPGEALLPKSGYTTSRVAADPKAAGLEKGLENSHAQLKKGLRDLEDLQETEQKQTAILDDADNDCDDEVESFELGLYALVKKNRGDNRYRRYFKDGLREITTAEARQAEPELVGQMLHAMDEDKADPELGSLVAVALPKLAAARDKVLTADKALAATETALAFLKDTSIPSLMAAWRAEYKKLEGALTTVYPTDPKKVDRFFKPFRNRRKDKKAEGSAAAPAPAATPAPAPATTTAATPTPATTTTPAATPAPTTTPAATTVPAVDSAVS